MIFEWFTVGLHRNYFVSGSLSFTKANWRINSWKCSLLVSTWRTLIEIVSCQIHVLLVCIMQIKVFNCSLNILHFKFGFLNRDLLMTKKVGSRWSWVG